MNVEYGHRWVNWPQARVPFSQETREYIAAIDCEADLALLATHGLHLRSDCQRVARATTLVLQMGAARNLTPFAIASVMCRWGLIPLLHLLARWYFHIQVASRHLHGLSRNLRKESVCTLQFSSCCPHTQFQMLSGTCASSASLFGLTWTIAAAQGGPHEEPTGEAACARIAAVAWQSVAVYGLRLCSLGICSPTRRRVLPPFAFTAGGVPR